MAELLRPSLKDISTLYEGEFARMAQVDVPLAELESVREKLIFELNAALTEEEKHFLLSFKSLKPDWTLLGLKNIDVLPAVRWKMLNLGKMDKQKHVQAVKNLEDILYNSKNLQG